MVGTASIARRAAISWGALFSVATALVGTFWTYDFPGIADVARRLDVAPPAVSTAGLLALLCVLCLAWSRLCHPAPDGVQPVLWVVAPLGLAALWIIGAQVSKWVTEIVFSGVRADMLIQIREAVERLASGHNPYHVYYVPWELPLSYGPALWMWYLVPYALQADLRVVTIFGQIFTTSLVAVAASVDASRRRYLHAAVLTFVGLMVLGNPLFERFLLMGHTPAYWPLVALFALVSAPDRTRSMAVVLGLLLGARTTMIALVPTFFIYLWRNDRRAIPGAALSIAVTLAVLFGPFLILDWRTLVYGLYGNYVRVITDFVWHKTNWMASTLGPTRVLVAAGWSEYVAIVQVVVMAVVYAITWWRLRSGESPAPWYCLALGTFCMTTLWPVFYAFLDAFVLGVCFFAAEAAPELRRAPWRAMAAATGLAVLAVAGTLLVVNPGAFYTVEAGRAPRWYLRSGFGPDQAEGGRTFAWALRDRVHLRLPRGLATRATIKVDCEPFIVEGAPPQTVGASLNGTALGVVALRPGWQTITFTAPRRAWRVGHNDLTLFFRYAFPSPNGEPRAVRVSRVALAW